MVGQISFTVSLFIGYSSMIIKSFKGVNCPQRFQNWPNLTIYYKRVITTMQIAITINFDSDSFIERYHVHKYS